MRRIEFHENVGVVARRDAVLGTVKGVHQRQDVAVEGKNKPRDETWCGISGNAELFCTHSLCDAGVKFLCGPETNDGVDDGGREDWGAAID